MPLAIAATHASPATPVPANHGEQQAGTWTFYHEHVLGTSLEVKVRAGNLTAAHNAEAAVLAEINRLDGILSGWRKDSEFSRWSQTQFQAVPVSQELFDVLAGFDHWRTQTGSALNPSAEAALRLWKSAVAEGRTPTNEEIATTVEAMSQPHWALDAEHRTATHLTDVPLALASFTKSYVTAHAAEAALRAGASGVMLNAGGDVVVRGNLQQVVDIADPRNSAENDLPLDRVSVRDSAVATSGSYRRSIDFATTLPAPAKSSAAASQFSHIVDPRTAQPTGHIISSTVISHDAETAAALATAFSVLSTSDSSRLAADTPGVDYLLVADDGRQIRSEGWSKYQVPGLRNAAYISSPAAKAPAADAGMWNAAYELNLSLDLQRIDVNGYRRPYVAVWIEDADHFPVRTLALWFQKARWLPELKQWYRDDQVRNLAEGTDLSRTVSSATRPPGHYTLTWDGKDNDGKPVKAGKYTVVVEASREHGSYQVERHEMNFTGQPQQATMPAGTELGEITLDYKKR
jgi:thiamine biosynthesis lipoprotein ApbE